MSAKLMTIEDLSEHLGVPVNTLYKWRTKGYGPTGRRVGKYVRYRPADVEAWIEAQGLA
ncbi:helix-turn-helix domain-containing protein [Amycolatopsis rubida]|uniref:Helix-turn-helix domain-containing protein n=1 Tax=Amycolatopsis rubida TaxID=112413 RepID=A0ABX0C372_9PSEU|nr:MULTISPECIES: helix-turn-helix domain-containing protein [Amycolatopsis]MYW97181.1 helix-turn-helix domain-containing protein [Amycolatopsis rubida]NEC62166.1 helix-turn-helix domain-containing protein [Amycolatopsis rubida]OAP24615.1 Helix-turn-helix domain protein [Amycolatopsis sp. M39]